MSRERELLMQALEGLYAAYGNSELTDEIEDELAKPEAEPVAWIDDHGLDALRNNKELTAAMVQNRICKGFNELYTRPPAQQEQLIAELRSVTAERDAILQQAKQWKMEAKTQGAIVKEIYQAITGAAGEPGDWNGAEPVKEVIAERDALKARIDGGVRVEILADNLELKGKVTMALFNSDKSNAVLILDEGADI